MNTKRNVKIATILTIFVVFLATQKAFALRPVESLVLGNFSDDYNENKTDPLDFVFGRDLKVNQSTLEDYKKDLAIYRGFYEEGKNLVNSCKNRFDIRYTSDWEKIQAERSIMAEVQYIGLDLAVRAIPQYAKYFEFTEEEYKNLVDDLVTNNCSTNISVISKKELRNNLMLKFTKENSFRLPSVKGNPLFPDDIDKYVPEKKAKEQEFKTTVKMFQALCSWSGDPTTPGLMVPFLKHGALMSFINRQLNNKNIDWDKEKNLLNIVENSKTIQVVCDNLICRKTSPNIFKNKIAMSVGSTSFYQDFKFLYCDSFQLLDYNLKNQDPRQIKKMKEMTFDDENFLVSQYIALITGYPDFLLGLEKYTEGEDMLRSSVDYTWSTWAKNQTTNLNRELYYEEPLTLELNSRNLFFNSSDDNLKMSFDVNLGEFDRIVQVISKLKMSFSIELPMSYITYHRNAFNNLNWNVPTEKDRLINRLKIQLEKDINLARDRLLIPPWRGDLPLLVAKELTDQIVMKENRFFTKNSGMKKIEIEINYSPFALKYINHQFNIKQKDERDKKAMTSNP